MRTRRKTPALALLFLLAASSTALAADDDLAFARALAQRGYVDVAERVLRRSAEGGTPERAAQSRLALAQLRRYEAVRAAKANSRTPAAAEATLAVFRDAENAYRAILSDPSTAAAARVDLARLLVAHAQFAGAAARPEPVAAILDEALAVVADAQSAARGDDEIAGVRLLRIEALHAKGAAAPASDALAKALEEIESFTWDYAGTLRCAWAFRWRGLVLARLGRTAEACESLRDAATSVSERDGIRGASEMSLAAYEDLARTAASASGSGADDVRREAKAVVDRLGTEWPRHCEMPAGRRARLAAAVLHDRTGDRSRAVAGALAVLSASGDGDPEAAGEACALLADWTGTPGAGAEFDPEMLALIARTIARGPDLARTVRACRALIAACTTPETRDRFAWDAWETMGRAYGAAGRWHEAYLAFERIESAWRREPSNARLAEITDSTAYYRADALARLATETGDAEDRAAAARAMSEFARDHPGSSFASGAVEQRAFRMLAEAAALRRSGDRDGATARGREALAALEAIGAESAMYDRAQAMAAEAHRQLGEFDDAMRLAEAWLDAKRPEPASPGARRSRAEGRLQALVTLFTSKADRAAATDDPAARPAAFKDFLDALTRRGADYLAIVPTGRDQMDAWRAEALLGTGDADAAEPLVLGQIRSRPSHPTTRYLASLCARADDQAAAASADAAKRREISLRAARLWEHVLESSGTPDAEVARSAGLSFRAGGDLAHAADLLSLAASLARANAARIADPAERERALEASRATAIEYARTLLALARFDEAETEASSLLARDDEAGAAVLARLATGEMLKGGEVEWLLHRAARNRAAVDVLAAAYSGAGSKERLAAAAQSLAALRYTLPREAGITAESVDLVIRHADAMARIGVAGGGAEGLDAAAALLDLVLGSEAALAEAEKVLPGAGARVADLRKRIAGAAGPR